MFVNIFSILIFALITSSIASDGGKSVPKSETKTKITPEEKDLKQKDDFDSLPEPRSKSNEQLDKSGHDAFDTNINGSVTTTPKATTTTTTATSTTTTTTTKKEGNLVSFNRRGCHFGGQRYFEGQFLPGVGGPCQACYCLRGQQQCTELRCKPPVKGCRPIFEEGTCCPVRYDCASNEKQHIRSEINGKLPRTNLLSDLGFRYNFDYDSPPDIDGRVMENHIRIVRESQTEPVSEPEAIVTTNPGISDEPSTVAPTTTTTVKSPTTTTTTAAITTATIKAAVVEANLKVTDFESTKLIDRSPVEETQNTTSKQNDLQVNDPMIEKERDTSPVEEVSTGIVPDIIDKNSTKVEDYALIHTEDETNITGTTDTPPEFYDDYYYDYEELEDTTSVPRLSINEILNKLRTKNEGEIGSLADILPDPITGTNIEEVNTPKEPVKEREQDKNNRVQDFVSYDVDVGASLIAGTDESDVIGVGQVIPIDLHTEEELPAIISSKPSPESPPTTNTPSTSTSITTTSPLSTVSTTETTSTSEKTKPQSSFLDTFLSLFRGPESGDKEGKDPSPKLPPLPPPPPFLEKPPPPPPLHNPDIRNENIAADVFEAPPPSFFRPPPLLPSENTVPSGIPEEEFDTEPKTNELDSELDFEAKPTIENEVRARPKPPNGSATRNQLPPIRRRPVISEGSKPFNPGLFASRPKLPLLKPSVEVEEDALAVELPSDPLVEGGFLAIKPADDTSTTSTTTTSERPEMTDEKPTLPPSLPNLQIIPFVAADALVNQGSPAIEEQNGFSPTPFGNGAAQDCREGGKVWKNGETVARGDNDPCVVCRCHLGKVICQRYECAKTPEGCTAEETPQEGECCTKITCDKSANVSIIDTLPSFRPIEEEKVEEPSKPIRPSPFSHHNRRPPFIPGLRRPKPSKPLSPPIKPQLPSAFRTTEESVAEKREIEEAEEKESPKPGPIRPIRPLSRQPLKPLIPTTTSKPFGNRPRPFSYRNRTGTRPPFVPPRRKNPGILFNTVSFTKSSAEETSPTSPSFTTTESSTTILKIPAFIPASSTQLPEEIKETARPEELDAETFENIFAGLLPKDKNSLPQPIHSDTFDMLQPIPSDTFDVPQPIPSDTFDAPQPIPSDTFDVSQPIPSDTFEASQLIPSDTFDENPQSDKPFILPPEVLLPSLSKPLPPTNTIALDDGDITNFVHQDKFRFTTNIRRPEVKFDRQPPIAPIRVQKPNKKLPEIPEVVKAQLPLGNDPILVSGILELAGCNVYGRMFEVGEDIQEISGQCKACQCTKVGVQCLPIC